jgi:iron complex outermembrane receptor protein
LNQSAYIRSTIRPSIAIPSLALLLLTSSASVICAEPGTPAAMTAEALAALAGRVIDAGGAPVAGAVVTLHALGSGAQQRVRTDAQGRYRFDAIVAGRYVIDATFESAADSSEQRAAAQDVRIGEGAAPAEIELRLDHAAREEQVVVTAADRPQRIDDVGKAITVMSLSEIEERHESAISELLRAMPGVQVTNNGGPGQFTQIRIRGLRADATAVLVDGLRLRDASGTQGDAADILANFNVVNPERLEVLRGSASSLYGTNATGGAINVVSRLGAAPSTGMLQIEGGQLGLMRERATIDGVAAGKVRYSAGLMRLDVTDGVDGNDSARSTDGHGTVAVQFSPATALTGRLWANRSGADLNSSPSTSGIPGANIPATGVVPARALDRDQIERLLAGQTIDAGDATYVPGIDNPDNSRHSDMFTGALLFTHHASDRVSLRGTYQRVRTSRTFEDGPQGTGFQPLADNFSEYVGTIDTADLRASIELRPDLLLTGGYEFEREGYFDHQDNHEPAASRVDVDTHIAQRSHALFAQASWQGLADRLHVAGAVRAQTFNLSRPSFRFTGTAQNYDSVPIDDVPSAVTGDAAVSYAIPSSNTKLRMHVGNAYRAPALYERFGGGFSNNPFSGLVEFSPYGDPLLEPDRYVSVDVGIDQSLAHDRVRVNASWFHTAIKQLTAFDFSGGIDPSTDPYGRFVGYLNSDGGRSRGIEFGAQARPSASLSIASSYTFADSVTDRDVSVSGVFRTFGIARHTFSATATQQVGERLTLQGVLLATSSRYGALFGTTSSRAYAYPGFATLDVGVSYVFPLDGRRSLRVYGKADNLFDRTYYDLGWRAPGETFLAGLSFSFGGL